MPTDSSPRPPRRMLVCRPCGRVRDTSQDDLMRYMTSAWPRCCGEVMALYTETERPGDDGTPLERPALPPDPPA